jgi:DNA-binding CsgD family transcriptional regulator
VHLELGLALAARWHTEAPRLLSDAISLARTPAERAATALPGARALGLAGYFGDALDLSRQGLGDGVGVPTVELERLEAELACNAMMRAQTHEEMRRRLPVASTRPSLGLGTVNVALHAMLLGEPASAVRALLGPIIEAGVLDAEMDSIVPTAAAVIMVADDDLEDALAWCAGLIDVARPRGWLIALAHASWVRSMALVRAGRIRSAEPDARLALDFKLGNTTPEALTWALHTYVDVLTEADRLDEADAALATADQAGDPPAGALGSVLLLQSRARLRLAQHRPEAAYADADAARVRCEELSTRHPAFASWRVQAAEALIALGDRAGAFELAQEHVRLADRLANPAPRAAGLCALAQAGEPADRVPLLLRAVELAGSSPARLEQVRAQIALGAALRRGNQRAEAGRPLRIALDLADQHGMGLLARRARTELQAAGARPRRPASTGPRALTPAEHRVVSLAGRGHSNRDIAGQLYVTRRTVETHLTHAFQKLGISSRTEIPDALHPAPDRVAAVG